MDNDNVMPPTPPMTPKDRRAARLAEELRANLKRRKQASRAKEAGPSPSQQRDARPDHPAQQPPIVDD